MAVSFDITNVYKSLYFTFQMEASPIREKQRVG